MKQLPAGLIAALLFALTGLPATALDNDAYFEIANEVLAGEPDIEHFTELREAYAHTSWYNPVPDRTSLEPLDEAIQNDKFERANEFINDHYFYFMPIMDFHLAAMATYRALDDPDTGEWHEWFFQRLVDSVFESGDGESPETAYKTVYEREQFIAMEILGLEPEARREQTHGERLVYVYTTRNPEGNEQDIYFDFTAAGQWLEAR